MRWEKLKKRLHGLLQDRKPEHYSEYQKGVIDGLKAALEAMQDCEESDVFRQGLWKCNCEVNIIPTDSLNDAF